MRHDAAMGRDRILALLAEHKPVLTESFGEQRLALFGSFARGTAREDSEVDVLVGFERLPTGHEYFGAQFYLEELFGRPEDLVSETALNDRLRTCVERDGIAV